MPGLPGAQKSLVSAGLCASFQHVDPEVFESVRGGLEDPQVALPVLAPPEHFDQHISRLTIWVVVAGDKVVVDGAGSRHDQRGRHRGHAYAVGIDLGGEPL